MKLSLLPLAFAGLASSTSAAQLRRNAVATAEDLEYLEEVGMGEDTAMHGKMDNDTNTIVGVAQDYHTLHELISVAGLEDALESEGPFTLFAPTDKAFAEDIGNATLAKLLGPSWSTHLADILSYHVVMGEALMTEDLETGDVLQMGNGETANVTTGAPRYSINGHAVLEADQEADNGVVHGIGSVLLPSWVGVDMLEALAGLPEIFGTLNTAIELVGENITDIIGGEGPFTLFAPTNAAFEKLDPLLKEWWFGNNDTEPDTWTLSEVLLYHLHDGIVTMNDIATLAASERPRLLMSYGFYAGLSMTTLEALDMDTNVTGLAMNDTDGIDVVASAFEAPKVEYRINDMLISSGDILVNNGIIHVIDGAYDLPMLRK